MITPERWRIVERIFDDALALPADERAALVDARCGDDAELRREVESLLAAEPAGRSQASLAGFATASWASDRPSATLVGSTIDTYRIVSLLGAGGMGEVYLAEDTSLGRRVALKVLPEAFGADPGRVRRFTDEARAASALNHPNILTVLRVGEVNDSSGRRYIATEFVDGETVRARVARGPVPAAEALAIATQVAAALDAAHRAGIVHRDIKPDNIMIRPDGYVKLLDFGLAKLTRDSGVERRGSLTRAGAGVGTPDYMAPEQAAGAPTDARADIYSLSVVLYEMLTGELPREIGSARHTPGSIVSPLPRGLLPVLRRGLASEPSARYQTVADLLRDLERIQAGRRWSPARAWGLAAAAVAAVGVAVGLGSSWRSPGPSRAGVRSLVVMPLYSLGDPNQTHLESGLADAIRTRLAGIPELRVPPASAIKVGEDPFSAARRLLADAVLTGSVQRQGDQLRITLQLTRAVDRAQIWSGRFDEQFTDIFRLEDTIAEQVASKLLPAVTATDRAALTRREAQNAEAYDLYLRAREQWSKRTGASIRTAVRMFEDAIALDPGFALAYAGLADCYNLTASGLDPGVRFPLAKAAADKALALDPRLGAAHTARAFMLYKFSWNWPEAEREFRSAVDLDPRYALAHHWFGEFLKLLGRHDESIREFRRAVELDPFSVPIRYDFILSLLNAGRTADARALLDESLAIDPNATRLVRVSAEVLTAEGRIGESVNERLREFSMTGMPANEVSAIRSAYRTGGLRGMHTKRAELLLARMPQGPAGPTLGLSTPLSQIFAELRDRENTLLWVTRATDLGEDAPLLLRTRAFAFLHDDPRCQTLMRRVGL